MLARAVFEALSSWSAGESLEPLPTPATVLAAFTDTVQGSHPKNTNRYLRTNLEERWQGNPDFVCKLCFSGEHLVCLCTCTGALSHNCQTCPRQVLLHVASLPQPSQHCAEQLDWQKRALCAPSHFPVGVLFRLFLLLIAENIASSPYLLSQNSAFHLPDSFW